jgi:uncharacterized membrane protein
MDALLSALLAALAVAALVFVGAVASALAGAFVGWLVGLIFDDTMRLLSQAMGISAAPYQLGAMFGFVGAFFRSTLSK